MATFYDHISSELQGFIENQHIFFVATAAAEGTINLSPKGMDSFRVVDQNKIIWLNLTGSGNETAAHLLKNKRMTIMFCSFEKKPLILRLYGQATIYHPRDSTYLEFLSQFPAHPGARQIVEMKIDRVQTSCGFAVPMMEFVEDRNVLNTWATNKGGEKIKQYWADRNTKSIDGFKTNIIL